MNLVEATAREIARVAELLPRAAEIMPAAGVLAEPLLREVIEGAVVSLGRGDAVETIRAYQLLRGVGSAIERQLTDTGVST